MKIWKDIKTAPKDRKILVASFSKAGNILFAYVGKWETDEFVDVNSALQYKYCNPRYKSTHWMEIKLI